MSHLRLHARFTNRIAEFVVRVLASFLNTPIFFWATSVQVSFRFFLPCSTRSEGESFAVSFAIRGSPIANILHNVPCHEWQFATSELNSPTSCISFRWIVPSGFLPRDRFHGFIELLHRVFHRVGSRRGAVRCLEHNLIVTLNNRSSQALALNLPIRAAHLHQPLHVLSLIRG